MIKKCLRTFRQSTCLVTVAKEYLLIKFQALIVYEQHFFSSNEQMRSQRFDNSVNLKCVNIQKIFILNFSLDKS